ncbi:reverse transcriptase domain-containing protein [Tanacetum coccineum]
MAINVLAKLLRAHPRGLCGGQRGSSQFLAEHFEISISLINMMIRTNSWDLRKDNPSHDHIVCLAAEIGKTFLEFRESIFQGYVAAVRRVQFILGELKAITTRSGLVLDGPSVPMPPPFINPRRMNVDFPSFISTRMTLELANREICTPVGIARDVFVSIGKFTFPADFVIVDYESDPRAPLILGRPFLRTAGALIDVHGEEIILCDGDERLILNMRHDTSSYSNQPHQESINMIDIYNVSNEEILEDLFATNHLSGNPTSSLTSHTDLTSPEVNDDIFDLERGIIENLLNLDKTKDLPPYHDNPLSSSTTSSSPSLPISETSDYFLEEFVDELALITFLPRNDDLPLDIESDL